jgi:hypothetical protein
MSAEMSLLWRVDADGALAPSGARLGTVQLKEGTNFRLLAQDVPEGGFSVRLVGRRLVLSLTSAWRSPSHRASHTITGTAELTLRN